MATQPYNPSIILRYHPTILRPTIIDVEKFTEIVKSKGFLPAIQWELGNCTYVPSVFIVIDTVDCNTATLSYRQYQARDTFLPYIRISPLAFAIKLENEGKQIKG